MRFKVRVKPTEDRSYEVLIEPERVILIMGRRGSGKTNLAKVFAEEFILENPRKHRVLVYDPMKEYPSRYIRMFTLKDIEKLVVHRGLLGLNPTPTLAIFDELSASLRIPKRRKVIQPVLIESVVSGRKWGVVPIMIVQSGRTLRYLQDVYENISDFFVFDILPGSGTTRWLAELIDISESKLRKMIKNLREYECLHLDILTSWRTGEPHFNVFKPRLAIEETPSDYEAKRIIVERSLTTIEKVGILAFHYGLSNEKIAELLGLKYDTVKSMKYKYKIRYLKKRREQILPL